MPIDWDNVDVVADQRGRVRCEPTWTLDLEWSKRLSDYDLWLVWAGRGRMWIDGEPLDLRPGVCCWVRPRHLYPAEQDAHDRLGVSFCHFTLRQRRKAGRAYPRDGEPAGLPGIVHRIDDLPYADGVLRRVAEIDDEPTASALLRGLLMDLDTARPAPAGAQQSGTALHHRRVVLGAAAAIRESPGDAPSVQQLAADAGYSADHFARVFAQVLGMPPTRFIVQQRIARSAQLLRETPLTVSQVADSLGYRDVCFFSRQFKQVTGQTPSAYRAT